MEVYGWEVYMGRKYLSAGEVGDKGKSEKAVDWVTESAPDPAMKDEAVEEVKASEEEKPAKKTAAKTTTEKAAEGETAEDSEKKPAAKKTTKKAAAKDTESK